jgi:hypothetical protein
MSTSRITCVHTSSHSPIRDGVPIVHSLCVSVVLCGSVVNVFARLFHHRVTEESPRTRRIARNRKSPGSKSTHSCGTQNALVKPRMAKSQRNRPWWLEEDGGICPACGHAYAYQTEYRCVACDAPMCSLCVETTIEIEICCVGCESTDQRAEAAGA